MLKIEKLQILSLPPLTFEVEGGACLAIQGPSGSGKSRLLRAIADLDPADGAVFLDQHERCAMAAQEWRARVRFVAAEPCWWANTALQHFMSEDAARAFCAAFALDPSLLSVDVQRLSTGERQRLALARALEDNPDVLLLDEPTSALDQTQTELVEAEILKRLDDGVVVLIASHDLEQVERLSDARLQLGRVPVPQPASEITA